ncbi:MAG TPA: ADP-ribosyl-(dinitrogen reductase) hydrolase [Limnobacter sp.]|nr:ADP-ribosyl-(dinitrogen reductase) hydrolase [Limnobacter sp.]
MNIKVSQRVLEKLATKHQVQLKHVEQCFMNREFSFLEDTREGRGTNPPTLWFIAETDQLRELKVVFVGHPDGTIELKSAFPPNDTEKSIYRKRSQER